MVQVVAGVVFSRKGRVAEMEPAEEVRVGEDCFVLMVLGVEWWGEEGILLRVGVWKFSNRW